VLLPVKQKTDFKIMLPVCAWALVMNFLDLSFNILPAQNSTGYPFKWLWLQFGCLAFMGGFLGWAFLKVLIAMRRSRKKTRACSKPWESVTPRVKRFPARPHHRRSTMNHERTVWPVGVGFLIACFLFCRDRYSSEIFHNGSGH